MEDDKKIVEESKLPVSSSNTQIIAGVAIVVILLLVAVAVFFLTKKDSSSEEVVIDRSSLETYESDDYIFGYPAEWNIQEGTVLFVHSTDVDNPVEGEFNDNVNIVSQAVGMSSISRSECSELGAQIAKTLESSYDTAKLDGTEKKKINGYDVCVTKYSGEISGVSIKQEQYFFPDKSGDVYIITTSLADGDANYDKAMSIVNTFEIK